MLYLAIEVLYAVIYLKLSWILAFKHNLILRLMVSVLIVLFGLFIYKLISSNKKPNLDEQFKELKDATIKAVFSPASLHVKSTNLLNMAFNTLPIEFIGLIRYHDNSLDFINHQGAALAKFDETILLNHEPKGDFQKALIQFHNKKIHHEKRLLKKKTLLMIHLKPKQLTKPIGMLVAIFKKDALLDEMHFNSLDFLAQNFEFLMSLTYKKEQALQAYKNKDFKKTQLFLIAGIEPYEKMQETLLYEFNRHKRYKTELSLILFQIDFYENLSNITGEQKAQEALKDVIDLTKKSIRQTDILGHWEKNIFGIILADNTFRDASQLAKKLQALIDKSSFGHSVGKITCSFGASTLIKTDTIETFKNRAKIALQKAQKTGGNKVEISLAAHTDNFSAQKG